MKGLLERLSPLLLLLLVTACSGPEPAAPDPDSELSLAAGTSAEEAARPEKGLPGRVALAPLEGVPMAEAARIWALARGALLARGFDVVTAPEAAGVFLQLQGYRQGVARGREDAAGWDEARALAHRHLEREFGAGGVVYVELVPREASVREAVARWDGAEIAVAADAVDPHAAAAGYRGTVAAWSVTMRLEDIAARTLAQGFGGLTVDGRLRAGRWESTQGALGLLDPERLGAAIVAAVEEMVGDETIREAPALAVAEAGPANPTSPEGRPVMVFFVRHAEAKPSSAQRPDPPLTAAGAARAQELARVLADSGASYLVASEYQRTQATLAPLAQALGVQVRRHPARQMTELVEALRALPAGTVAVVAGHSNTVPQMVAALGGRMGGLTLDSRGGAMLPHDVYDRLVQVVLPSVEGAAVRSVELRYGD